MRAAWLVLAAIAILPSTAWAQSEPAADAPPAATPPAATPPAATPPAATPPEADVATSTPTPGEADAADAPAASPDAAAADAPAVGTRAGADPEQAAPPPPIPPKIAVVVSGDPDPLLQAAALEVEAQVTLAGTLRLPADAALRAALRGDAGAGDDGLEEVRRERRRLGLGEASDAPILQRLGRRAGAVLVVAIREGPAGPEGVALDVNSGRFFEGTLALSSPAADTIAPFVTRRARVAARGAAEAAPASESGETAAAGGPPAAAVPAAATEADEPPQQRDWFEENWPYLAAGVLLAGAIVFVVVTATQGGDPPPMLRFEPGTP